ncbi:hypothetical protein ABMA27_015883 [Loxostege sticticalis]|uniref:Cyclin C-terminal domain-containing protein n=1 Tax=Loxostege sticticalis TaxID=481309 RepID=A0ABR3I4R7_LOXSC
MELLCAERVSPGSEGAPRAPAPRAAQPDPVLLRRRVLDNLLRTEERYAVTANYFGTVQTEISPHMRRLVAEWMLESWELLVLSKLKWDVAGVTAHDFLPLLLSRLPLRGLVNTEMVQRHAQTFIALAARDYQFTLYSASTLAACSIAAALRGLTLDGHLARLQELTRTDLDCLQTCLEQIEEMVDNMIEERAIAVPNGQNREAAGWTPPPSQDKAHSNAATPTDVRDVHF